MKLKLLRNQCIKSNESVLRTLNTRLRKFLSAQKYSHLCRYRHLHLHIPDCRYPIIKRIKT